jgi:general secretion pathway protein D
VITVNRKLMLLSLAISLSYCTASQPPASGPSVFSNTSAASAAGVRSQNTGFDNAANEEALQQAAAERQRLVDEINRDGRAIELGNHIERAPEPTEVPDPDVVSLNYEQAELRSVLAELADALDISMVIDPTIADQVSLRTAANRPLQYDDIWPLMRTLSRAHGVTVERAGDIWYARKSESSLPAEIASPGTLDETLSSNVMLLAPLTYVSATAAIEMLTPILEPDGQLMRMGNSNAVAITATTDKLERVSAILEVLDDDPFRNQGIQLYPLMNASAAEVAQELTEILGVIEGSAPSYQIQGLARINAILVTAPAARGFDEISRWVAILDADRQEQNEQLFRYRVKNLNAVELAATLTDVFQIDERNNDDEDNQPIRTLRPQELLRNQADEGEQSSEEIAVTPPQGGSGDSSVSANLRVSIVADEPTNSLLIRANPRDYRQLLTTINQLDSAPLQVMINAVIAQVVLTDDKSFGVDWSRVLENADGTLTRVSTNFLPTAGQDGSSLGGLLFNRAFLDGAARVEATLEAIAINNDVRLLARPSLSVINNQEGLIRIGAEVPVQLGETVGVGGTATTNIQYRPTGIELQITPRINDDGVVNLTIRQELSSVSGTSGVNQNPIFQNQEIETTVIVRDGENVILGGLIQESNDRLNSGVPFLNQVPVLGNLFSYQQDNNERTELFIVLRPEIVNVNQQATGNYQNMINQFELAAELLNEI